MITIMTSPPAILQGSVEPVQPTRMAAASASPAHQFLNVVRDLVAKAGYHNENEVLAAHRAIDAYERQVISASDLRQVASDNDRAPYEDVSRRPAPSMALPAAVLPAGIDYDKLAAALMAAQQQAVAAQQAQQQAAPPAQYSPVS
jgi:hypothetical protein